MLGCGLMGSGIAEVCARHGRDVVVVEADAGAAEPAGRGSRSRSAPRVNRGKLTEARARRRARLALDVHRTTGRRSPIAQLVVEAISEDPTLKVDAFRRLDDVVAAGDAILASNTSSIPIMKLATATARPEQVIGLHFFNPVPVLPLVELVPSLMTVASPRSTPPSRSPPTCSTSTSIRSQDRAGFVVNALLIPYLLSRDPDARVRLRHRRGHRHRDGPRLRAPDGPARAVPT